MARKDKGAVYYVYVLFRPDGTPCYIGKGHRSRWTDHDRYTSNPHLRRIIACAGGSLPRIKLHEGLEEATAYEYEIALIAALGREKDGGILVNLTKGGEGCRITHSEETRAKLSANMKKHYADPAARALTSATTKAAMARPEVHKRTCEAQKKRVEDPAERARLVALCSRGPLSEAHKRKISAGGLGKKRGPREISWWTGKKHTDEAREKIKAANAKRPAPSKETRAKLSAASKAQWARGDGHTRGLRHAP